MPPVRCSTQISVSAGITESASIVAYRCVEAFKSSIKLVKKRFTGALHPDKNGDMMLMLGSSQPKYTGEPREEVDKNWNTLIEGQVLLLINYDASADLIFAHCRTILFVHRQRAAGTRYLCETGGDANSIVCSDQGIRQPGYLRWNRHVSFAALPQCFAYRAGW